MFTSSLSLTAINWIFYEIFQQPEIVNSLILTCPVNVIVQGSSGFFDFYFGTGSPKSDNS